MLSVSQVGEVYLLQKPLDFQELLVCTGTAIISGLEDTGIRCSQTIAPFPPILLRVIILC